jgi:two-component system cell cycle sensor histidine kinase/response regulator CckA
VATVSNGRLSWQAPPEYQNVAGVPLEFLPFPAALTDPSGIVISVNPLWQAEQPSAAAGQNAKQWCTVVHGGHADRERELSTGLADVLAGRATHFVQDYGTPAAPRRITVSSTGSGALLLQHDLAPAHASAVEVERGVQSRKMETVGRLVSGVAHDFANLLTLIAGYSDLVLNRVSDKDPLRGELEEIRKAANRGARLTSQLLGFTRNQAAQPKVIDLNGMISDMQRMLRPLIGEYVELQTIFAPNLGKVLADPGQTEQVIMNLILNARDAMPKGGRIRIETSNGEISPAESLESGIPAGPAVRLSVSDTGHGIDSADLEHIFEPFFTTKEKGKGTGLGLSTVYSIVKGCGGHIWVRSAPGSGATFTVVFPRTRQAVEGGEAATQPQVAASGSETVLLVEDEDGVRKLLSHILRRRGYTVLEAANGDEAVRIFAVRGDDVHLVLTDMVMPGMSGRETAECIRQLRPEVKVMYMSGYTGDVLVRTGALGPGMPVLQKPLRPDVLVAKVREMLDTPRRHTSTV